MAGNQEFAGQTAVAWLVVLRCLLVSLRLFIVPFSYFKCRKSKKKKSAPSILSNGRIGQVGKFKNGTLILSPVDIKKINSSRVAK